MYLVFLPLGIPIGFAFLLAVVNTLHASLDWRLILLLIMTIALGFYAANFDIDWISGMGPAILFGPLLTYGTFCVLTARWFLFSREPATPGEEKQEGEDKGTERF